MGQVFVLEEVAEMLGTLLKTVMHPVGAMLQFAKGRQTFIEFLGAHVFLHPAESHVGTHMDFFLHPVYGVLRISKAALFTAVPFLDGVLDRTALVLGRERLSTRGQDLWFNVVMRTIGIVIEGHRMARHNKCERRR